MTQVVRDGHSAVGNVSIWRQWVMVGGVLISEVFFRSWLDLGGRAFAG